MTSSNPVFLSEERLKQYFKTFKELHELHAKQNKNLIKLVENHEKRISLLDSTALILSLSITELTKRIEDLT